MYASSIFEHAEDIIKDNMDREFAIRPAVNAHKRGEYALSVPIFFAQAEGILSKKREKYLLLLGKPPALPGRQQKFDFSGSRSLAGVFLKVGIIQNAAMCRLEMCSCFGQLGGMQV